MFEIFYSWQSDRAGKLNRHFIGDCAERAIKKTKTQHGIAIHPRLAQATSGAAGAPSIEQAIFEKIAQCDGLIADVTVTSNKYSKPSPNPNVMVELGYALAYMKNKSIILVMNTFFGPVEKLPFDIRNLRTLTYSLEPEQTNKSEVKKALTDDLTAAILGIAEEGRNDPIYGVIYPRTFQVYGCCKMMLSELIRIAKVDFNIENLTQAQIAELCEKILISAPTSLVVDLNNTPATVLDYIVHCRRRSQEKVQSLLKLAGLLKGEQLALLILIEECSLFSQVDKIFNLPINNMNLSWLSNNLWEYLSLCRRLLVFAESKLAARAGPL